MAQSNRKKAMWNFNGIMVKLQLIRYEDPELGMTFEFRGILCRHVLYVLTQKKIKEDIYKHLTLALPT
jgi:hypothetical protein